VTLALQVHRDLLVQTEVWVQQELLALRVLLEQMDLMALLGKLVLLVLQAPLDHRVQKEILETQVLQDRKVQLVMKVGLEQQGLLDHKVQLEQTEQMVQTELQVQLVLRELLAHKAILVFKVLQDLRAILA
jgi:hypothetical protein